MTREKNDWRLTGQERYLKSATLTWQSYRPANPSNDHDHCEFCQTKFMEREPGTLHEGYATPDRHRWVCKTCVEDFAGLFSWKVVAA
jgi:hypothetical protein